MGQDEIYFKLWEQGQDEDGGGRDNNDLRTRRGRDEQIEIDWNISAPKVSLMKMRIQDQNWTLIFWPKSADYWT